VRSENGYGFLKPGLKTGVGNGIFWSEIGSGFGDAGGTPRPKIPRSTPHPPGGGKKHGPKFVKDVHTQLSCSCTAKWALTLW